MRRFLIVGSSGQIGTALATEFLSRGFAIQGIDPCANPWIEIPTEILTFEDIRDDFFAVGSYTDIVMLATTASARQLQERPELDGQDRQRYEKARLVALNFGMRLTIVSSRELFGKTRAELEWMAVNSAYEAQKRDMELAVADFQALGGEGLIARVPVVFGGYDTDIARLPRLVPRWCSQFLEHGRVEVSNGENAIELLRAEDAAKKIAERLLGEGGGVIEIRGVETTLATLAKTVEAIGRGEDPGSIHPSIVEGIDDTYAALRAGV